MNEQTDVRLDRCLDREMDEWMNSMDCWLKARQNKKDANVTGRRKSWQNTNGGATHSL